jgi:hypothetical protein
MAGPSCDTITTIYTLPDLLLSCQRRAGELMLASRTSTVRKPILYRAPPGGPRDVRKCSKAADDR